MDRGASPAKRAGDVPLSAVREATGRADADIRAVERQPVVERVENMTTLAIERVTGTLADGTRWSMVAKTLRPVWAAPAFAQVPEEHRAMVIETLHWFDEPRVYRSALAQGLPQEFRMPRLYGIEEDPDRLTLWLEDVADHGAWTVDRYRRTARSLGRMSGRWPGRRAADELGLGGRDVGTLFFGRIVNVDLPIQATDAFWRRPAVREAADDSFRRDLFHLAGLMPSLLRRLEDLPAGLCHGDACPANFLEPGDGTVVGIDWSYGHVGALGSDLAQLLAGRFESGSARAEELELLRSRAALGRFGLDLALRHADG